jgi:trans-aconitate methyltransferase
MTEEQREIPAYDVSYAYPEKREVQIPVQETVEDTLDAFVQEIKDRIQNIVESKEEAVKEYSKIVEDYKTRLTVLSIIKQKEIDDKMKILEFEETKYKGLNSMLEKVLEESRSKNEVFDEVIKDYREAAKRATKLYTELEKENQILNSDKATFNKAQIDFQKKINEFNRLRR